MLFNLVDYEKVSVAKIPRGSEVEANTPELSQPRYSAGLEHFDMPVVVANEQTLKGYGSLVPSNYKTFQSKSFAGQPKDGDRSTWIRATKWNNRRCFP